MPTKARDFAPRKRPVQERSRATFDAIVTACTWLLPELGYAGTSTNHIAERAGVNISSLYEYFPGKDAIVAEVAERLVQRVLRRLAAGTAGVMVRGEQEAVRLWIHLVHETVARERELVAVFVYQVPFTHELPPIRDLGATLLEFSQRLRAHAQGFLAPGFSTATLHLLVNLVSSTVLQVVLDPPRDLPPRELLEELIDRIEGWIHVPGAR